MEALECSWSRYGLECSAGSSPTLALVCQTASLLNAVPSALDECVHSVPDPRHLKTVLHYHAMLGHLDFLGEVDHVMYLSESTLR